MAWKASYNTNHREVIVKRQCYDEPTIANINAIEGNSEQDARTSIVGVSPQDRIKERLNDKLMVSFRQFIYTENNTLNLDQTLTHEVYAQIL